MLTDPHGQMAQGVTRLRHWRGGRAARPGQYGLAAARWVEELLTAPSQQED